MRSYLVVIGLVCAAMVLPILNSCSDDDDGGNGPGPTGGLAGIWYWSDIEEAITMDLRSDGSWRMVQEIIADESCTAYTGTWTANATEITQISASGGSYQIPYSLEGNFLHVGADTTDVGIMTFERVSVMTECDGYVCGEDFLTADVNESARQYGCFAYVYWNGSANVMNIGSWDFVAEGVDLSLTDPQVGTFSIGGGEPTWMSLTGGYFANGSTGSGEITITELSDSCVAGTFHGVVVNTETMQNVTIENGEFSSRWVLEVFP